MCLTGLLPLAPAAVALFLPSTGVRWPPAAACLSLLGKEVGVVWGGKPRAEGSVLWCPVRPAEELET